MQLMNKLTSDWGRVWTVIVILFSGCLQAAPLLAQSERDPLAVLANDF